MTRSRSRRRLAVLSPSKQLPRRANGGAFFLAQTPYSQLGEALGKEECHDNQRTRSSHAAWGNRQCESPGFGRSSPVFSKRLGQFIVVALPIGPDGIHRAAEEMITEHGSEALAEAKKRARTVRSEGFESLAKTWDLICAVIRDVDDSKHSPKAY